MSSEKNVPRTSGGNKRRYYALGFGSNYYGSLGETLHVPAAAGSTAAAHLNESGAAFSSSSAESAGGGIACGAGLDAAKGVTGDGGKKLNGDGNNNDGKGPYRWGHVRILTLGQTLGVDTTAKDTARKSYAASESLKSPSSPNRISERNHRERSGGAMLDGSNSGGGGRRSGHGFKKGFLLSPKRKGKKSIKSFPHGDDKKGADNAAGGVGPDADNHLHTKESVPDHIGEVGADTKPDRCADDDDADQDENDQHAHDDDDEDFNTPCSQKQQSDGTDSSNPLPAPLSNPPMLVAAGSTHTVYVQGAGIGGGRRSISTTIPEGTIMQSGTMHGTISNSFVPRTVRMPLKCIQISCGRRHVLALMGDGPRIASTRLELFDGPISPTKSASTSASSAGGEGEGSSFGPIRSAFEALTTGLVMSWGAGHFGQLGHGPNCTDCAEPTAVEGLLPRSVGGPVIHVSAGPLHSAAIVATSSTTTRAFLFGSNRRGQCGVEGGKCNTVPYPSPLLNTIHAETGKSVNFVRLSLGRLHGIGLTESGEVYTWGSGTNGRCGHGDSTSAAAAKAGRGVRTPRRIDALKNVTVVQVCAGDGHSLALTGSGRVFAWGTGSEGQLGQGHTMHLLSPRLVGDLDFAGIHSTYDAFGKLLPRKSSAENLAASCGAKEGEFRSSENSAADTRQEHAFNASGSVGIAPALPTYMTSPEAIQAFQNSVPDSPPQTPPKIVSICAAGDYSAALSSSGDLYTWGYGDGNNLGHDARPASSSPCSNLGAAMDRLPYVEPGPISRTGAGHRIRDSCSFDSRLNVLLPRRVECTREVGLRVEKACLGPGHMVLICSTSMQSEIPGMTLFEIETKRRSQGLSKLRLLGSSRKKRKDSRDREAPKREETKDAASKIRAAQQSSGAASITRGQGSGSVKNAGYKSSKAAVEASKEEVEQAYKDTISPSGSLSAYHDMIAPSSSHTEKTQASTRTTNAAVEQRPSAAHREQIAPPKKPSSARRTKASPLRLLKKTKKKMFGGPS